jgi:endonuclease III
MKNAKTYESAMRKFLGQLPKRRGSALTDPMEILLESILLSDATGQQAQEALDALKQEYVDLNDLRVSPPREIAEVIGEEYPRAREKALGIVAVLGNLSVASGPLSLEHLRELPKRELRRRLGELGLDSFASAAVTLRVFGGHAVPVDATLVEVLELDGLAHPGSSVEDVQGFLERVVNQKDALEVFEGLRVHVEKHGKILAKHRQSPQAAVEEAEERAQKQAEQEAAAAAAAGSALAAALLKARQAAQAASQASKSARRSARKS